MKSKKAKQKQYKNHKPTICCRKKEINLLFNAVKENRNVLLLAPTGWGKTSLLKLLSQSISKEYHVLYFAVFEISDENIFLNKFYNCLSKYYSLENHDKKNYNKLTIQDKIISLLDSIKAEKKQFTIIIDDYKSLFEINNGVFENIIFPKLLELNTASLIFAGNKNIFPKKIFEELFLVKPKPNSVRKYIIQQLHQNGKQISENAIDKIIYWSMCEPYTLSIILKHINNLNEIKIKRRNIEELFSEILSMFNPQYQNLKYLLSAYQWKFLVSIAREREATQITSASFIAKNKLNAPSSVKTALDALVNKQLIIKLSDTYQVSNAILINWLNNEISE